MLREHAVPGVNTAEVVSERLTQICAGGLIETLFVGVLQLQKSIAGLRKMALSSVALLLVGDEKQV